MEARRSIATERGTQEVLLLVIVLQTREEALGHIFISIRAGTLVSGTQRVVQLTDERIVKVVVGTAKVLILMAILLITGQQLQMMGVTGKARAIVGQILVGDGEIACMVDIDITIAGTARTELASQVVGTQVAGIDAEVGRQGETLDRGDHSRELSVEKVAEGRSRVQLVVTDGITHHVRTLHVGLVRVIQLHTILVHDVSISIANIEGIDRTHVVGDVENVA